MRAAMALTRAHLRRCVPVEWGPKQGAPLTRCFAVPATSQPLPCPSQAPLSSSLSHDKLPDQQEEQGSLVSRAATTLRQAASPSLLAVGSGGFGVTAAYVANNAPQPLQMALHDLDLACHLHATTLGPWASKVLADILISDFFIAAGMLGWTACTVNAFWTRHPQLMKAIGVCWAFYLFGAGPLLYDPFLIDAFKETFSRVRPDIHYHPSFSFPSGHTSSAVFLIGALCFVLVPITNIYMRESGKQRTTRAWRLPGVLTSSQGSWALWLSSALVTGTGRVLADAHWLTDCVGASFVSMALVSLLARVVCKTTGAGLPAAQLPAKKLM